jgi:ankyrin repeat protein
MPTIEAFAENLFRSALGVGDADTVQIALQAGVNPNSLMGWDRITPLQLVVGKNNIKLTRILLCAGADVNAPPTGDSGLTSSDNIELIWMLLDAGADVNAPSRHGGTTALREAVRWKILWWFRSYWTPVQMSLLRQLVIGN